MPHSIPHNDACLALFNKNWGIPPSCFHKRHFLMLMCNDRLARLRSAFDQSSYMLSIRHEFCFAVPIITVSESRAAKKFRRYPLDPSRSHFAI
jgi:hypothetical protein